MSALSTALYKQKFNSAKVVLASLVGLPLLRQTFPSIHDRSHCRGRRGRQEFLSPLSPLLREFVAHMIEEAEARTVGQ
jgi:hypothetical protein